MNKIIAIAALVATIGFTASCSKSPDKALPRKDGVWNVTSVYTLGTFTNTSVGVATFKKDGTVTWVFGNTTETKNWSYSKDNKKITLAKNGSSEVYDVTETALKSEKWQQKTTVAGITATTDITLTKK